MQLLPHQIAFIEMIYGSDPQPKLGIMSLPRGNGKTALIANLALCHLLGPEAEARGAVYSAATDRAQAALTFAEIEATICAIPEFSARCAISGYHKRITVLEGRGEGSVFEALAADAPRAFGLAPTLWLYDELAQAKDRKLLDALMTSSGKRANSFGIIISTQAQTDDHPLSILIDEAEAGRAPATACQLMAAPMDADPFDIETIRACNPAAGVYLNESDLIAAADMASAKLCVRAGISELPAQSTHPHRCRCAACRCGNLEPRRRPGYRDQSHRQGLHLLASTSRRSTTSPPSSWPSQSRTGPSISSAASGRPWGRCAGRRPGERELFEQWINAGYLIGVPGDIIDPAWVLREIAILATRFQLTAIRYDQSYMDGIKLEMAKAGVALPFVEHQQGFI